MGDIADQIVDGEICEQCMCPEGEPKGYPFTCRSCSCPGRETSDNRIASNKANCPLCNARVRKIGLQNHVKDSHPEYQTKVYKAILAVLREE